MKKKKKKKKKSENRIELKGPGSGASKKGAISFGSSSEHLVPA